MKDPADISQVTFLRLLKGTDSLSDCIATPDGKAFISICKWTSRNGINYKVSSEEGEFHGGYMDRVSMYGEECNYIIWYQII